MSRFEESALRNSVSEAPNPSTLPYWHPESRFSSLIDPQHDAGFHQLQQLASQEFQPVSYPATTSDDQISSQSQPSSMDMGPHGGQQMNFGAFDEFAQIPQDFPPDLSSPEHLPSPSRSLSIKTPTGARSMRRPGLAGAAALINGQYCCQWSSHGAACRHKFMDAKSLNDHIKTHHVRGAGNFTCFWSGCDKGSFPTANKLVRHVHSHTGYKPFPCPSCAQAFVTKDQLDKHLTTHTGAKDFVCTWPGCGRSFAVKHALDGHMNSVHLKAKKHICPHCAQAFDDSSNLSKHKKQVHNPETAIKCPARHTLGCAYVDSRKDKMKEHCEGEQHGLETVSDPHAWNMWVQQFKTASKKSEARRHSIMSGGMSSGTMSRASSAALSTFAPTPRRGPIECSKQGCNVPVCLPCNILCNDMHSVHDTLQPCDEPDCDPCEPCDGFDCDPSTRQPCNVPPCSVPHCRSGTSTPSQPATPHGVPPDAYFQYHPISTADGDMFHDNDHPFHMTAARLHDYTYMH